MNVRDSHGGADGLGAMGDQVAWIVDDLRRTGEQLRQAVDGVAARTYEAASPDGTVRVGVNGRCRITSLELDPSLMRKDPDALDALLAATLNTALARARASAQEALTAALPPGMRSGIGEMLDEARREAGR